MSKRRPTGFEIPKIETGDLVQSVHGLGKISDINQGHAIVFSGNWNGAAKVRLPALEFVGMSNPQKAVWKVKGQ